MISSQIPKGEIWILKADSLIIVEEGKSPSKQIKPEITITYTADENLSVISDGGYQYREKSFDPDTIFISDNNEKVRYSFWGAFLIPPNTYPRTKPYQRIEYTYYPDSKRLNIFIDLKGLSHHYFMKINEIQQYKQPEPLKPGVRRFEL